MTDPRYTGMNLTALRWAATRGTSHKHRLMAWAADQIEQRAAQTRQDAAVDAASLHPTDEHADAALGASGAFPLPEGSRA